MGKFLVKKKKKLKTQHTKIRRILGKSYITRSHIIPYITILILAYHFHMHSYVVTTPAYTFLYSGTFSSHHIIAPFKLMRFLIVFTLSGHTQCAA